jgi:serine/threonine protein kinase
MIFGVSNYPYTGENDMILLKNIESKPLKLDYPGIPISKEMKDLLSRMIVNLPEKRIGWHELYQHEILSDGELFGSRLTTFNEKTFHAHKLDTIKNMKYY